MDRWVFTYYSSFSLSGLAIQPLLNCLPPPPRSHEPPPPSCCSHPQPPPNPKPRSSLTSSSTPEPRTHQPSSSPPLVAPRPRRLRLGRKVHEESTDPRNIFRQLILANPVIASFGIFLINLIGALLLHVSFRISYLF